MLTYLKIRDTKISGIRHQDTSGTIYLWNTFFLRWKKRKIKNLSSFYCSGDQMFWVQSSRPANVCLRVCQRVSANMLLRREWSCVANEADEREYQPSPQHKWDTHPLIFRKMWGESNSFTFLSSSLFKLRTATTFFLEVVFCAHSSNTPQKSL